MFSMFTEASLSGLTETSKSIKDACKQKFLRFLDNCLLTNVVIT